MSYQAESIANAFIELANKAGKPISNMKLQKLLYFAQGHSLSIRGKELIKEDCEAWDYGPVFPDVYRWCKHLGSGPITKPLAFPFGDPSDSPWAPPADPEDAAFVADVWNLYQDDTALRLSELSHVQGGPWDLAYKEGRNAPISKDSIKHYFSNL